MLVRRTLNLRTLALLASAGVLFQISGCNLALSQISNLAFFLVDSVLWSIS